MNIKHHILVIDPIPFAGGSKVATRNMLDLVDKKNTRITVVTVDPDFWQKNGIETSPLYEPRILARKQQGIFYFLRHLVIVLSILYARIMRGKFDIALGASGPGVDLSVYLAKKMLNYRVIQLIHGPVAASKTIGRALMSAHMVYYLDATRDSLIDALAAPYDRETALKSVNHNRFKPFTNGLSIAQWPTPSFTESEEPVIFWAASLLKWKGLDTLLMALEKIPVAFRPKSHICYIRPKAINLAISNAPVKVDNTQWYESPENLDSIRSCCNIFVSTSHQEPFGLSILEALAAGHCVLIPADGAYWDRMLVNEINCVKYAPDNAGDLAATLLSLSNDMDRVNSIGSAAKKVALDYLAQIQYAHIVKDLETGNDVTSAEKNHQPILKAER